MLDASSSFLATLQENHLRPERRLLVDISTTDGSSYWFNNVDVSERVIKWPKFKHSWNDFAPNNTKVTLSNADGFFNRLHADGLHLTRDAKIQLGLDAEYLTLFQGNIDRLNYSKGRVDLNITDKWDKLTRRLIGTDETPVEFSDPSSIYYAHDIAWTLVTCYGGYSSTQDSSNPDIDYSSFNSWTAAMSSDAVRMGGEFRGEKVSEALTVLGKLADTAIYVDHNNKLSFKRFSIADTLVNSFTPGQFIATSVVVDENEIQNKVFVNADWNTGSDTHETVVIIADSASVNSYGPYEVLFDEEILWLVGSSSAQSLGQRRTNLYGVPHKEVDLSTTLYGLGPEVGDPINIYDPQTLINGGYRVLEKTVDLEKLLVGLSVHNVTLVDAFVLDYSALDSSDILT